MTEKIKTINDKVIEHSFYLLFFLVPLILTPFNYELFEFNKMMLVYLLTTVIVAAWLMKMIAQKKILFRRTFMDFPFLIFLGSQILSTLFSIDRHTSLWGYYSRFHGGLISTFSYLLLYWAYVANMNHKKTLSALRYALFAAVLVTLYGVAEHFGIDAKYWVQDVRNRVFSSLGQPNWLAAWLVAIIPLTWGLALNSKSKGQKSKLQSKIQEFSKLAPYFLFLVFYLCLLYTKSRSGLLGFTATFLVFWGLIFLVDCRQRRQKSFSSFFRPYLKPFIIFTFFLFLLTSLVGTPWTPNLKQLGAKIQGVETPKEKPPPTISDQPAISESGEIRQVVWKGALEIWKHYPLFGTGVETFAYSYYWYRPREHNDLSEWDFLYNKAHNEYLNFAATSGTVGLLANLSLIGAFSFWVLRQVIKDKKNTHKHLIIALLAGFISIPVTNFFGFSVVAVALLFFLYPAMGIALARTKEKEAVERQSKIGTAQYGEIIFALIIASFILIKLGLFWYADTLFARGGKLSDNGWHKEAYQTFQWATAIRPGEPFYHDEFALAAANLAVLAEQKQEATLSAQLIEVAISESDKALKISPYHLNFWKNRTRVFYKLAEIDEEYSQAALASLLQAAELAPTDAKIHYNLGLLYVRVGQEEEAIKTLEKTVELKPNYADARYALALFYEKDGKIEEAREQLEYILEKIDPNHEAAKEKMKEL